MSKLLSLFIILIILQSILCHNIKRDKRQSSETFSTALATTTTTTTTTLNSITNIIMPTIRSLIQAPIQLFRELLNEIRLFLNDHNFIDMFNINFFNKLFIEHLPERIRYYWSTFLEMENECIQRTLCDLADYIAHHVPHWFKQILLIYFTTFNQNIYYEAINNGLIVHNCQEKFSKCNPNSFLSQISGNMTSSLHKNLRPINVAINDLVNVTLSTIDTVLSTTTESSDLIIDTEEFDNLEERSNQQPSIPSSIQSIPKAYVVPLSVVQQQQHQQQQQQQQQQQHYSPPQVQRLPPTVQQQPPAIGWQLDNQQPLPQPQPAQSPQQHYYVQPPQPQQYP